MKSSFILKHRKFVAWTLVSTGVIVALVKSDIANLTVYRALGNFWPFFLTTLGFYLLWAKQDKT